MTWEEVIEQYKQLFPQMAERICKRSEIPDDLLYKIAHSCLPSNCLCGHNTPTRCPCGQWRGTWREQGRNFPAWWRKAGFREPVCPFCGRPEWCET